ncbi:MAG: GNAT family N-acetyltransferase [Flavobacteriales bacterium]|nr:GNAT family N-acetyltransferase [Flavobacteriales bacterium]
MQFFKLTKFTCSELLQKLILADKETPGESWNEVHFLTDLPGKWDFSVYSLNDQSELVAFLICSLKKRNYLHIHRFVVIQKFRRKGIGSCMLNYIKDVSRKNGVSTIGLKVYKHNQTAITFYIRNGFRMGEVINDNIMMTFNF